MSLLCQLHRGGTCFSQKCLLALFCNTLLAWGYTLLALLHLTGVGKHTSVQMSIFMSKSLCNVAVRYLCVSPMDTCHSVEDIIMTFLCLIVTMRYKSHMNVNVPQQTILDSHCLHPLQFSISKKY